MNREKPNQTRLSCVIMQAPHSCGAAMRKLFAAKCVRSPTARRGRAVVLPAALRLVVLVSLVRAAVRAGARDLAAGRVHAVVPVRAAIAAVPLRRPAAELAAVLRRRGQLHCKRGPC